MIPNTEEHPKIIILSMIPYKCPCCNFEWKTYIPNRNMCPKCKYDSDNIDGTKT